RGGGGVDLEVAAGEHDSGRGLDGEGEAVEDAVRDAYRMHAEGPDRLRLSGPEGAQVRVRSVVTHPPTDEAQGAPAAEDGSGRRLEREGQGADVVLVAVREEAPPQSRGALAQVLEVGGDGVDTRHLGARELDVHVPQ